MSGAEDRLRHMVDRFPVGIFHTTPQGQLIDANQAFLKIVGYDSLKAVNTVGVPGLYENPAIRQQLIAQLQAGPVTGFETRFRRRDGNLVDVLISVQLVQDETGSYLEGILQDNTQHKLAEKALQESEQRFRTVADFTYSWETWLTPEGRYLYVSPACQRISGYPPQAFIDRPELIVEIAHLEDRALLADHVRTYTTTTETEPLEYRILTRDGQVRWINHVCIPVHDAQGNFQGRRGSNTDITDRKRLEREIQESLERRGFQVQTVTDIAQEIAAAPELSELFQRVVTLIKERFDYYHAQIFRYDPEQDAVVLVAGYGEVGEKMHAAGHQLAMGRGLVGTAAATSQTLLASDVAEDKSWRPNPNLPDTKGELAVPITIRSGDAETQLNTLKYFTNGDFDGFAVTAIDSTTAAQVTHEAVQNGKAVVGIAHNLGPDNQSSFICADNYQLGYLLGAQAGAWAKERVAAGEILKLGMLNYRASQDTILRENGILDGISTIFGPNIEVVISSSMAQTATVTSLVQAWLQAHPDLHMIVSINDSGALDAYEAARAAGYHDPARFFIGGIDGVPAALKAIQEGSVYQATVNQPPEIMGILLARVLIAKIKGLAVKPAYQIKCVPINRSNVANYLGPRREAVLLAEQREIFATGTLENLDGTGLRLGLSVISLTNPFFVLLVNSAQKEAQRLGAQLSSHDPRRILGVLDVQSDKVGALGPEDQLLLEGLCGQIAIAIESRRAEEALRQSETHFRAVTESANYAIITANSQGVITNWNHGADLIFQYTGDEVVGQPLTRLMSERYRALHLAGIERVSAGGEQHVIGKTVELQALRKTGEEFPIELSLSRWESQAGIFYTAIITDIAARREAETQMQETLHELERLYRATTREGWQTFLQAKPVSGYQHDYLGTHPVGNALPLELEEAIQHNTIVPPSPDHPLVAVPLAVRGEVIGAVGIFDNDPQRPLTLEQLDLVQAISEQGALALESARLFEQTQRDAERERTINRIAGRIRSAQSVDQVLEIAAQELSSITRASRSVAEITPQGAPKRAGNGNGTASMTS